MNNVIKVDFTKNKNKRNNKSMVMGKLIHIETVKFERWVDANLDDLQKRFEEYVDYMQDSWEHKQMVLNKPECFYEWAQEQYETIKEVS